ncbi:putative sterigmatocystin biosynthesis monooxygenase stcW [Neonectria ditissima]|uniref:Putative sterigmatocystin biosynthesis monooxygenase stcW n=1 Tax=Neonectria ditissima TaxID=78410 RepID=A0A0P7BM56_9HYPO|nr:putative sterigmatocystin biosynthesis monooxygenase stcW [Neonectria ditissima]
MIVPSSSRLPDYFKAPGLQPRFLRVIGIGAGASGLLLAYKLQRNFDKFDLKIFEKNDGIGGTWWENNYPGYFKEFYTKYGLEKYIKTSHAVVGCFWDQADSTWTVNVHNTKTGITNAYQCDVLISATGVLNAWKWPDVPGIGDFKGVMAHSAAWDNKLDLKDKTVALVGNGSSGIQILPAILPEVKRVINLIRSPAWISTPFGNSAPRRFSEEEKINFAENPEEHLKLRKSVEATNNGFFKIFLKGSPEAVKARQVFSEQMGSILDDADLAQKLIPSWSLGCRRLTPGVGYLEALKHPKTQLVYEALSEITEVGVVSAQGSKFDVDVIICASGFDTSFIPKFPLVGLGGKDLRDVWGNEPRGYLGLAVPDFPNFFTFLGSNCPIGNGPVLSAIEAQGDYICKVFNRLQTEHIKTMSPTAKAAEEFMEYKEDFFQTTVWSESCRSWYKLKHTNKVSALWVGSTIHYLRAIENPRYEDWDIKYMHRNRWSYLGNGLGPDDVDPAADLAYYVRQYDDSPILGSKKTHGGAWAGNRGESVIGLDEEPKEPVASQDTIIPSIN